jgi:hypothetical protein
MQGEYVPRDHALGLVGSRRTQIGDLGGLELRQGRFSSEGAFSIVCQYGITQNRF